MNTSLIMLDYMSFVSTPDKPMRNAYDKVWEDLNRMTKEIEERKMRDAFMLGYTRVNTWETCVREGKVQDTPEARKAFMAGYVRFNTWEQYNA